mgnify:CR=1 FL=1
MAENNFKGTVEATVPWYGRSGIVQDGSRRSNPYRRYDYFTTGRCIFA